MMPTSRLPIALVLLVLSVGAASAEDQSSVVVAAQIAAAEAQWKTAKLGKFHAVETSYLLVYSSLAEDKLKPIAEAAQKVYDTTAKALQYGDKSRPWAGKLTVFLLPDRSAEFIPFLKLVEQRAGKIAADENVSLRLRGEEPSAIVGLGASVKVNDVSLREETAKAVAVALLDQKAGAPVVPFSLPTWIHDGFGRAMLLRSDPNGRLMQAHRMKLATLFTKAKAGTFTVGDTWADGTNTNTSTLQTSLLEFMLYGPEAEKFTKFLAGYKPSDDNEEPSTDKALELAGWKPDELDAAWKKWVSTKK